MPELKLEVSSALLSNDSTRPSVGTCNRLVCLVTPVSVTSLQQQLFIAWMSE